MNFPRLIYYGPTNEDALVRRVEFPADLAGWLAAGWRLTRQADPETEIDAPADRNPDASENVAGAAVMPAEQGAQALIDSELAGTDQTAAVEAFFPTDPAPPAAVADAPRPEDSEPSKASSRKKR